MKTIKIFPVILYCCLISFWSTAQDNCSGFDLSTTYKDWYISGKKAPLFFGLDGINFPITTKNPEARKYFNQGLMLSYAFNHAEAARSFSESIRLDSSCAMCYWGYALVLGPNYNVGMEKDNIVHAYRVAQQALALSNDLTEKERMLIMAITMRYDSVPAVDRSWNDETYAFTMGGLYQVYPDDPDIGALYAEALLNQHPRDLWNQDGTPKTWTTEIVKVLENVISKNPKHPGANHFYILAVETSLTPERAMPSADLLRELVPVSHLLHMPSHIYIRTGRYHDGTLANQKALEVDNEYISACHAQGVYPLAYFPHMLHFMAATATLEGDQTTAILASRKLREQLDKNLLGDSDRGTLQNYYSIFYFVMLKFGLWDEILKEPPPDADLPYPRAILEYVKGMAAIAKKDIVTAQKHLIELEKYLKDSAALSINLRRMKSENDLMTIAHHVLRGEMLNQEGKVLEGIEQLRIAVAIEDRLHYKEAFESFFYVRHHLASVLLENKYYAEAEIVLREDLKKYPLNGWALSGLGQALQFQGKLDEAKKTEMEFEQAWKFSTVTRIGIKKN